jgi:hypothetical protein
VRSGTGDGDEWEGKLWQERTGIRVDHKHKAIEVEYLGSSESKATRTSKDDKGENKNEMFDNVIVGALMGLGLRCPKGVAVNIRDFLLLF